MEKPQFLEFPEKINGYDTCVAVLVNHWDKISRHWNEDTAEQYIDYYNRIILPHFAAHPLEHFADEGAYEELIQKIQLSGTVRDPEAGQYSPSTLQKFRHLIRLVLKVGAEQGMCLDVLWGTRFAVPTDEDPDAIEAYARTRLRKSLMPDEEYAFADLVFVDPLQEGERMFALLSLATGGRPQEVADLRWGDILLLNPAKNRYGIALLTTVHGASSKRGGKTRNMYRFIPISQRLYLFLMTRRAAVAQAVCDAHNAKDQETPIGPIASIEELFICCAGKNYLMRCSLQHASNVCRDLLRRIGIKESLMRFFEKEAAKSDNESVWGKEKLATTYILRRHFCTLLYALGLKEAEILYLMGHSMDHLIDKRSDFRYTPFMDSLCDKLAYRPIMNPFPDWNADAFMVHRQNASVTFINVPQKNIQLDNTINGGTLTITVTPNEANDPICIDFNKLLGDNLPVSINGTYKTSLAHGGQRDTISVIADLLRLYQDAQKRAGSGSTFVRKYGGAEQAVYNEQNIDDVD